MKLADLAHCFEGVVPPAISTAGPDGMPNLVRLSKGRVLDDRHIVLSRQFFRKTAANLAQNPQAVVIVVDPSTYVGFQLDVRYLRSETSGPLFETLSAEVDAIASLMGMAGVFRLQAADVFEVLDILHAGVDDEVAGGG